MRIIGIDPGQDKSGYVVYDSVAEMVEYAGHLDNGLVLNSLRGCYSEYFPFCEDMVTIEGIEPMGLNVGKSVFETCVWIGRFQEAWENRSDRKALIISRGDEKIVLCGSKTFIDPKTEKRRSVTNSHIRRSLLDKFPAKGGGRVPQIGTKANPGPLYGISGDHCWSALAVIITALITKFPLEWRKDGY